MTWEQLFLSENLKLLWKEFQFAMSLKNSGAWHTLFAILLHYWRHRSDTIATTELKMTSTNFTITLQTDFLKINFRFSQTNIFLKSFNSVFNLSYVYLLSCRTRRQCHIWNKCCAFDFAHTSLKVKLSHFPFKSKLGWDLELNWVNFWGFSFLLLLMIPFLWKPWTDF